MSDIDVSVARWQQAGLVTPEQATAIVVFERDRLAVAPAPVGPAPVGPAVVGHATPEGPDAVPDRRATAAEAVGYVGAAFAVAAVGRILAELWDGLTAGGRLSLSLLLTVVLAGAAAAAARADSAPVQRLASVLSTGAVLGVAWCTGLIATDALDLRWQDVGTSAAVAATAAALVSYLLRRRALPLLTLLGASAFAAEFLVVGRWDLPGDLFWAVLPVAAVGGVAVLLAAGGYLRPPVVASTAGLALILVALQVGSFDGLRAAALWLAVLVAAGAVAAAVATGVTAHLAVGAVGTFVLVPQLVAHLFGDAIGVPATMLVVGLLLVVLAIGLGRARREVRDAGAA